MQSFTTKQLCIALFVFTFLLNSFLIQGIPFFMHGHDDFSMAWTAKHAPVKDLLNGLFFDRLSLEEDNFYFGLGYRSTYFLISKALLYFDHMQSPNLNYFFRILIFSLTTILLFKVLQALDIRTFFAFFGALLYATAVPIYEIVHFIGDLAIYSHFFMLLCFYLFLTKYIPQPKTNPLMISLSIFLSGLLAIKSKQIAIVIPVVLLGYCLFVKRDVNGVLKRRIPLFSVLLFYYFPSPFVETAKRSLAELWLSFRTYYFYNPWTKFGAGEQLPSILSPVQSYVTVPGSLLGIYKFLFGWFVLALMVVFLISLYKNYKNRKKIDGFNFLLFILLWHSAEVFIMSGYFQITVFEALRYIGIAVPSFIALTFFCIQKGMEYLERQKKDCIIIVKLIFVVAITLTILSNMYTSATDIRGALLARHVLIHDSIYVVYGDYFDRSESDLDDTIFFRVFHESDKREEEEKLSQIFFTDLASEFGQNYDPSNPKIIQQKIDEQGKAYIATFRSEVFFKDAILLKKLSACPPETSFYCWLKDKVKGQEVYLYIFKVTNGNTYIDSSVS